MTLEMMFAFLALFFAVKSLYDSSTFVPVLCAVAAWLCAVATVVLVLT